ncbi:MAG: sugar phosphate isomerase/epimerase [Treponema sp.]|nr:sugar phosphate isomerase/epimerase [Candidatus Treponema equi]
MNYGMPVLIELGSLEENCTLCKKLGLDFIELNMNFPEYQVQYFDAGCYSALKEKYGIYFTIHLSESFDVSSPNNFVREAWLKTVEAAVDFAKKISCPVINMHMNHGIYLTLPTEKVYVHEKRHDEYFDSMVQFRSFCEKCIGDSGIKICIENMDGFTGFEKEAVDYLLQSAAFGLTWDVGHSISNDESDMEFILSHVDKLCHFHIHDGTRKASGAKCHQELGTGEVNLISRLSLARECNARCVLETKTVKALENSVEWLQCKRMI